MLKDKFLDFRHVLGRSIAMRNSDLLAHRYRDLDPEDSISVEVDIERS